jgi:hypothetical protein
MDEFIEAAAGTFGNVRPPRLRSRGTRHPPRQRGLFFGPAWASTGRKPKKRAKNGPKTKKISKKPGKIAELALYPRDLCGNDPCQTSIEHQNGGYGPRGRN